MAKIREPEGDQGAKVDMTPMIDVTFLLIIFFVTIQQITVAEQAANVTLPKSSRANPETTEDRDRLIISIDEEGTFYVGKERYDMEGLRKLFKAEAGEEGTDSRDEDGYARRTIFIRADVTAPYGKVQDIMAECRNLAIHKLAFRVKERKKQNE